MNTYTVTTESGAFAYQAETRAEALRQHTQARPGSTVLGIVETSTYRAHADALDSFAD